MALKLGENISGAFKKAGESLTRDSGLKERVIDLLTPEETDQQKAMRWCAERKAEGCGDSENDEPIGDRGSKETTRIR